MRNRMGVATVLLALLVAAFAAPLALGQNILEWQTPTYQDPNPPNVNCQSADGSGGAQMCAGYTGSGTGSVNSLSALGSWFNFNNSSGSFDVVNNTGGTINALNQTFETTFSNTAGGDSGTADVLQCSNGGGFNCTGVSVYDVTTGKNLTSTFKGSGQWDVSGGSQGDCIQVTYEWSCNWANGWQEFLHYNNWQTEVGHTPEPATLSLFGIGLLGLAYISRRHLWGRRRNAKSS